jgi:hypothetical protein
MENDDDDDDDRSEDFKPGKRPTRHLNHDGAGTVLNNSIQFFSPLL